MKKAKKKPSTKKKLKVKHRYNWRPDLPDQRDFKFSEKVTAPTKVPSAVDLRESCPPIVNQGQIGSCTGNALAGHMGFLEIKGVSPETFSQSKKFAPYSRLFIYYNERVMEGDPGQDGGAQIRDGIKTLSSQGACKETTWKYAATQLFKKPSVKAYSEASEHAIGTYLRLGSTLEMKQCLAEGFPFVFGFTVYESFESPQVAKTGIMPIPATNERVLGGHAVMAVGYNDTNNCFIVRNSWGPDWGQQGYFMMPYEVMNSKLAQDFWTIRR